MIIYIYIFQETRLSVFTVHNSRGSFHFSILFVSPAASFFVWLVDRRFRGGNWLYSIRPTELIAVIFPPSLPPLYRIVHRSIRILFFNFPSPLPPWFILFPPFNHRIGWARFCEKSLKSAAPPRPSPEIRWRDHFFLPRDCKQTFIGKEIFSLSLSLLIARI